MPSCWEMKDIVDVLKAWEARNSPMAVIQKVNSKRLLAGFAGLAVIGTGVWFAVDWFNERQSTKQTDVYVQEIIAMLGLAGISNFHQRIDKVRNLHQRQ
jgi:energy-converting hydrogenase Eha subunit G